ncbi:hypothetical protein Bca101_021037 [Brassica carinata]
MNRSNLEFWSKGREGIEVKEASNWAVEDREREMGGGNEAGARTGVTEEERGKSEDGGMEGRRSRTGKNFRRGEGNGWGQEGQVTVEGG